MEQYANIIGTGRYLPLNEVTNETFSRWMAGVNPALADVVGKFESSSNIKTRFMLISVPGVYERTASYRDG